MNLSFCGNFGKRDIFDQKWKMDFEKWIKNELDFSRILTTVFSKKGIGNSLWMIFYKLTFCLDFRKGDTSDEKCLIFVTITVTHAYLKLSWRHWNDMWNVFKSENGISETTLKTPIWFTSITFSFTVLAFDLKDFDRWIFFISIS